MPFYEDYGRGFHYYYKTNLAKGKIVPHLHPAYELGLYLHDSPNRASIYGQELDLSCPTAMLLSPFCLHQNAFRFKEGETVWERAIIYFGDELAEQYPAVFTDLALGQSRIWRLEPETVRYFHGILTIMNQYPMDGTEQQLLFLLILRHLFSLKDCEILVSEQNDGSRYIGDVIRYMSKNLSEGLTADSVAASFFISRSKLNKDFKKYTSTTFHQLLCEMKMCKAMDLLGRGITDIRKVAIAAGFENESYFYALFKKRMGITPLHYAKQCRERIAQKGTRRDSRMVSSEWGMMMDF